MRVEPHRRFRILACLLLVGLVGWAPRANAQTVTLETMLIHASDRPAALDRRLDKVEYRLRRVFGFEHYAFLSERRTLLTLPSTTKVAVGEGYILRVEARRGDGKIKAQVEWSREDTVLLRTSISQKRGVPAILGGPPHNGGTLILVLEFN